MADSMAEPTTAAAEGDGPSRADAGLQAEQDVERDVEEILRKHGAERGGLIAVLAAVQARCGYLPEEALRSVARAMARPLADVYGIATFYRAFSLRPRGKHFVCACLGTACHVRGGPGVVEEIERQLGIQAGETTDDGLFTLETVNCLGACALGPVLVIDGYYHSKVRKSQVRRLLDDARAGLTGSEADVARLLPLEVSCPRCNHALMDPAHPIDDRPSIRVTVCFDEQYGRLRLSSWYGGEGSLAEPEIPAGRVARFLCPHCHDELTGDDACPQCDAPMATLLVRGGGAMRLCARRGCPNRRLDLP
jgi:NADH:ubiquinone oxidoreductase subunit E